jgi:hypothetical protein
MQQQYKCLEERVSLVEMKMDEALSAIEGVSIAVGQNAMILNEALSAISELSLHSQKSFDGLSAQLKEMQGTFQNGPSNPIGANSKAERSHKEAAISEPVKVVNNEKKFGYESEQMSESSSEYGQSEGKKNNKQGVGYEVEKMSESSGDVGQFDPKVKKQTPSSSSDGFPVHKKSPVQKPIELHLSSGESTISESSTEVANKIRGMKITAFNQAPKQTEKDKEQANNVSIVKSAIHKKPVEIIYESPVESVPQKSIPSEKPVNIVQDKPVSVPSKESAKSVQIEPTNRISFKGMKLCEWKQDTQKINPLGQGKLELQASNQKILVTFESFHKRLNYWKKVNAKSKIVGERKDSVMFHSHNESDSEGNGPVKTLMAIFSSPSIAKELSRFFEENCEK